MRRFGKHAWLAASGWGLMIVAAPLDVVSRLAYFVLWYLGCLLAGIWLVLNIRAGRR
jgi:hypothetical protein